MPILISALPTVFNITGTRVKLHPRVLSEHKILLSICQLHLHQNLCPNLIKPIPELTFFLPQHMLFSLGVPILVNGIKSICLIQTWQENWLKYNLKEGSSFCLSCSLLYSHHLEQSLAQRKFAIKILMSSNIQRQENWHKLFSPPYLQRAVGQSLVEILPSK